MKAVDVLMGQHVEVLAQLAEVEKRVASGSAGDFGDFAGFLESEVAHHFEVEEAALFPLMERHLGSASGPLAVMNAEHAAFRQLVQSLRAAVGAADIEKQRLHAREIVALLRSHIDKEDNVLFPMAMRILSDEEQGEVDSRAAALEESARP